MTWLKLIMAALATWEVIEIWRHGSLFATWRARVELWEGPLGQLLRCGFCLAPWVGWLMVFWYQVIVPYCPWSEVVPAGFAVARLANLGNDLGYSWCRTPNRRHFDSGSLSFSDQKETEHGAP